MSQPSFFAIYQTPLGIEMWVNNHSPLRRHTLICMVRQYEIACDLAAKLAQERQVSMYDHTFPVVV